MDKVIFQREDSKYSALWGKGYRDANWRKLARVGLKMAKSLGERVSLIGFGRGSAMDFFEERGIKVGGVEISRYALGKQVRKKRKVYLSSLEILCMLRDKQFNIEFCNDVLEHVPEDLVAPSLNEMSRVCSDYLLISVCPEPSHRLSLEGENLHLTVRPASWWEKLFMNYGKFQRVGFLFGRSARYAVDLK